MSTFGVFMSYCRQENTRKAIDEALDQVENALDCNGGSKLSKYEAKEFGRYVRHMVDWLNDSCLINSDGELDEEQLESYIEEITTERMV